MRLRWTTLLSPLLALAGTSSQTSWSNLGLLSSQASKRSVEDSHVRLLSSIVVLLKCFLCQESLLTDDMVTSASDNLSETDNSYDLSDFKAPESRVEPHRRRKK